MAEYQNRSGYNVGIVGGSGGTEPPVSVPIVAGVSFAAKAEADPPDDPPGTKLSSIGLITFPKKLVSFDEPIANSSQLSLPKRIPPSFHKFSVTVDS